MAKPKKKTLSNEQRYSLIEKAGKCNNCGATSSLLVHHKNRDRSDNRPENLEVVCHDCHQLRHESQEPQVGELRTISSRIEAETYEWLRKFAFENRKSQGQIVREALKEYQAKQLIKDSKHS